MAVFKCKMCGGELEISDNQTIGTCIYCNSTQTLPKLNDDKKANLYARANHYRMNNEYDKAIGIYEQILNEDNTDAESYWSLVLCNYGVEYVEDPVSHKRIPTIHRVQKTSVLADENYKSALQYADSEQKAIYEEEAKYISDIQKKYLAISDNEDPFDVFICYKETNSNGQRTHDSVDANDIYHQLTQVGLKVFYARITLEDKLGCDYEPYIFAALNSAKVMIVIGSKPEYFQAVWVKNEWSRFLSLIKNGEQKTLIPAYKNMDAYDLPDELSHLQSQDMSKIGFMQDLIRGIKKVLGVDEKPASSRSGNGGNSADALLKRVFLFLEDGNWHSADEYCEKILDINPECAEAYLGKIMASLKIPTKSEIINQDTPLDKFPEYKKVLRYASDRLKDELVSYNEAIRQKNQLLLNETTYKMAIANRDNKDFKTASELFARIIDYKDSKQQIEQTKQMELEYKYNQGMNTLQNASDEQKFDDAADIFRSISDYKDSNEQIRNCQNMKLEFIYSHGMQMKNSASSYYDFTDAAKEFERLNGYKDSEAQVNECHMSGMRCIYQKALELKEKAKDKKDYLSIIELLQEIPEYPDSKKLTDECEQAIMRCIYQKALELKEKAKTEKEYLNVIEQLQEISEYPDSKKLIDECEQAIIELKYSKAMTLMKGEDYENAVKIFQTVSEYKDAKLYIRSCNAKIHKENELSNKIFGILLATTGISLLGIIITAIAEGNGFSNAFVVSISYVVNLVLYYIISCVLGSILGAIGKALSPSGERAGIILSAIAITILLIYFVSSSDNLNGEEIWSDIGAFIGNVVTTVWLYLKTYGYDIFRVNKEKPDANKQNQSQTNQPTNKN